MRKKIIGGLAIVAIAAIGTLNIGLSSNNDDLSVVTMANIEALASGESVNLPCKSAPGETCNFACSTGDGSGTCSLSEHRKI